MATPHDRPLIGTAVPAAIPSSTLAEACDLLGLPADRVLTLTMHPTNGITATLYLLDPDERKKIAQGDYALTYDVHIPIKG